MAGKTYARNPFYVLILFAGASFLVTAIAYGFMAFQQLHLARAFASQHASHPLVIWLREYGNQALLIELTVLVGCTIAAMATDGFWESRAAAKQARRVGTRGQIPSPQLAPDEFAPATAEIED